MVKIFEKYDVGKYNAISSTKTQLSYFKTKIPFPQTEIYEFSEERLLIFPMKHTMFLYGIYAICNIW